MYSLMRDRGAPPQDGAKRDGDQAEVLAPQVLVGGVGQVLSEVAIGGVLEAAGEFGERDFGRVVDQEMNVLGPVCR